MWSAEGECGQLSMSVADICHCDSVASKGNPWGHGSIGTKNAMATIMRVGDVNNVEDKSWMKKKRTWKQMQRNGNGAWRAKTA